MKKTISITIKGINFLLEEDAYAALQNYLSELNTSLAGQEGKDEIIEDIEIRIAELFSTILHENKQVIEMEELQKILSTLGDPKDYILEGEDNNNDGTTEGSEKRLFRDEENSIVGGVCAGVANFFNVDVLIIRIIWALFAFFAGFGVILYIILWFIVPKTNSSIDRLRMRGIPITVDNIKEEVDRATANIRSSSKKMGKSIKENDAYRRHFKKSGRIIGVLVGLFTSILGLTFLIAFSVFIVSGFQFIPAETDAGFLSISDMGELLLPAVGDVKSAWIGTLLIAGGVITFLLLISALLLFNLRNRWSKYVLLLLVAIIVAGGIICASIGVRTARDCSIHGEIERTIGTVNTKTLYIQPQDDSMLTKNGNITVKTNTRRWMLQIKDNQIYQSDIHIQYKKSADSLFHIYENFEASGYITEDAIERAKNISHLTEIKGDTLFVGKRFHYPVTDKIRGQDMKLIIEIPEQKDILFNETVIQLDNDFDVTVENYRHLEKGRMLPDGRYKHYANERD